MTMKLLHRISTATSLMTVAVLFLSVFFSATAVCGVQAAVSSKKNMSSNTFLKPDFAFPEDVAANAAEALAEADKTGNSLMKLKAAVQTVIARDIVSNDRAGENALWLDSLASTMKEPYSSLCLLLEGRLYNDVYSSDSWTYDRRTLPAGNYSANPKEWSRDLFAMKALEIVDKVTAGLPGYDMPVSEIAALLSDSNDAQAAGMTVADFILLRAIDLLQPYNSGTSGDVIPFGSKEVSSSVSERVAAKADSLMDMFMKRAETSGNITLLVQGVLMKTDRLSYDSQLGFVKDWLGKLKGSDRIAPLIGKFYDLSPWRQSGTVGFGKAEESDSIRKSLFAYMNDFVSANPKAPYVNIVKNDISAMSSASAGVSVRNQFLSTDSIIADVTLRNMTSGNVHIFSIPGVDNAERWNLNDILAKGKRVHSGVAGVSGEIPFEGNTVITFPPLPAGNYCIIVSRGQLPKNIDNKSTENISYAMFCVSDIMLLSSHDRVKKGNSGVYVVRASDQAPVDGAVVSFLKWVRGRETVVSTKTTDSEGFVSVPEGYHRVRAEWKGNYASGSAGGSQSGESGRNLMASVFTDLSIYRPGSEVDWAVVAYESDGRNMRVAQDRNVDVVLRNASYEPVDTVAAAIGADGRCSGKFRIPSDMLLGTYSITVSEKGKDNAGMIGRTSFEVAEYKTPTFEVTLSQQSNGFSLGDEVVIKGEALTYSGMPVAGASVSFDVDWSSWRYFFRGDNASYGGKCETDAEGKFEIKLPTAALKGTRYESGVFTVSATVTSPAGESQESAPVRFALGKGFRIVTSLSDRLRVDSDSIAINVDVIDMLGNKVGRKVEYEVADTVSGKVVVSGSFMSPRLVLSSAALPSGPYRFSFSVKDEKDTESEYNTVVFRTNDKRPPVQTPLWTVDSRLVLADDASTAMVPVGSSYDGGMILCVMSTPDGIQKRSWLRSDGEMTQYNVALPAGYSKVWVEFCGARDLKCESSVVEIVSRKSERKMQVKTETFRSKLLPGAKERWTFAFSVDSVPAPDVNAMAVMSDKALNTLAPFAWSFSPRSSIRMWNPSSLSLYNTGTSFARYSQGWKSLPVEYFEMPSWYFYGENLYSAYSRGVYYGVKESLAVAPTGEVMMDMSDDSVTVRGSYAARSYNSNAMMKSEAAMETETAFDEEVADGGTAAMPVKVESGKLRPVEMPKAFFMPALKGDADGNVSVEFEVPDFNTTWQFQILGYDREMMSAVSIMDAVASRPVMVQTNLPKFLRTGDRASVSATLFNNSDEKLEIGGRIVVFDAFTGNIVKDQEFVKEEVETGGGRVVSIDFSVPDGIMLLGVRSYAESDGARDGEQASVNVLPSSQPVIEAVDFYMSPGDDRVEVRIPDAGEDGSLSLSYCDNPVWECVSALPAISEPSSSASILSVMSALFANSLSSGIVRQFPEIRAAIAADGMGLGLERESPLAKDSALKLVALKSTPWTVNAASESLRMQRLSELLDEKKSEAAVASLLNTVKSRVNYDGGWGWCPDMSSSVYITSGILLHFAMLDNMKSLPEDKDIDAMIRKAVAYCDKVLADDYVKNKREFSTAGMLSWLYVRSFFRSIPAKGVFGELKGKALERIRKDWRDFDIYDKATAATLLYREKHAEDARLILSSLTQNAMKSKSKGWWFDNLGSGFTGWPKLITTAQALEAYSEIEPGSEAVDGLRQWLVLQKQTEDWGADSYTSEVIYSVLSSGSKWTLASQPPVVRVDGRKIELPEASTLSGRYVVVLDAKKSRGGHLTLEKSSASPAWGGIVNQYVAPIKDIAAKSVEDLSVSKEIYVVSNDGKEVVENNVPVRVGDRVRVTIKVSCGKDMDYVALMDSRSACLQPVEQLSGYSPSDNVWMYKEVRESSTNFYIPFLAKGDYVFTYDCFVEREGDYADGIVSGQCLYAPVIVAHSAGSVLNVGR